MIEHIIILNNKNMIKIQNILRAIILYILGLQERNIKYDDNGTEKILTIIIKYDKNLKNDKNLNNKRLLFIEF